MKNEKNNINEDARRAFITFLYTRVKNKLIIKNKEKKIIKKN